MPVTTARHNKAHKSGGKSYKAPHWHIREKGGRVVGHSPTKRRASISAGHRNAARGRKKR